MVARAKVTKKVRGMRKGGEHVRRHARAAPPDAGSNHLPASLAKIS
jgi:hypothetical protein